MSHVGGCVSRTVLERATQRVLRKPVARAKISTPDGLLAMEMLALAAAMCDEDAVAGSR